MIRPRKQGFTVFAESGRRLGSYPTYEQALHRLRQVEWWKRHKQRRGGRRGERDELRRARLLGW